MTLEPSLRSAMILPSACKPWQPHHASPRYPGISLLHHVVGLDRPPHGSEPAAKSGARHIGRTKGGLNSKLHAACDGQGRLVALLLTEGQRSDHHGAALLLPILPPARELLGDRGTDSNRFRAALTGRGSTPCIPSTRSRKMALPCDRLLYRQRHRIENAFGRLKDWRRVATRCDQCAHTLFSAICIAAVVTF